MAWEKVRRWKEIIRREASRVWGDVEFGVARVLLKTLPLILTLTPFNHLPLPVKRHTFHFQAFKGSRVLIFTYSPFREGFLNSTNLEMIFFPCYEQSSRLVLLQEYYTISKNLGSNVIQSWKCFCAEMTDHISVFIYKVKSQVVIDREGPVVKSGAAVKQFSAEGSCQREGCEGWSDLWTAKYVECVFVLYPGETESCFWMKPEKTVHTAHTSRALRLGSSGKHYYIYKNIGETFSLFNRLSHK